MVRGRVRPGEHPHAGLNLAVHRNVRVVKVSGLLEPPAFEPLRDAVQSVGSVEHDHVAGRLQRGAPSLDGVLPVEAGFDVADVGDPAVPPDLVDAQHLAPGGGVGEGPVGLGPPCAKVETQKRAAVGQKLVSLVELTLRGSKPRRVARQETHGHVRAVHVGGPRVLVARGEREDPRRVRLASVHRFGQLGPHGDDAALVPHRQVQREWELREDDQRHGGDALVFGEGCELRAGGGERRGERREQKPKLLVSRDAVSEHGPANHGQGCPSLLSNAGHHREGYEHGGDRGVSLREVPVPRVRAVESAAALEGVELEKVPRHQLPSAVKDPIDAGGEPQHGGSDGNRLLRDESHPGARLDRLLDEDREPVERGGGANRARNRRQRQR